MKYFVILLGVIVVSIGAWFWWYQTEQNLEKNPDSAEITTGEHSDLKQDLVLIVSESIIGNWQSTEDLKFVRQFQASGIVTDLYDSTAMTSGTWQAFSKDNPLLVSFPLEPDTVYLQLAMAGSQTDKLNFKLTKLTPETLELIYLERGGALQFNRLP